MVGKKWHGGRKIGLYGRKNPEKSGTGQKNVALWSCDDFETTVQCTVHKQLLCHKIQIN